MREAKGNLWTWPADVRVITTNGFVKKNGECVMGKGCAREAAIRWPDLPKLLGDKILKGGNHCHILRRGGPEGVIVSFPVKHNWWERADPLLIKQSAEQLVVRVDGLEDEVTLKGLLREPIRVVMPRPGCGNGNLLWQDVKPLIEPILDARFTVITF